jgi:SAM-dependent methyltransferase
MLACPKVGFVLVLDEHRPPVPPADLMLRVIPSFDVENMESARWSFDVEGFNNLRLLENAAAAVSPWHYGGDVWLSDDRVGVPRSFADFERLLDFGCGCGRFIRHLRPLADSTELHGTDIDAEMIEWLRRNVPFGRFQVAPHEPPLPYPDHYFDLVLSHSVFSHLNERLQDLWLAELQRVTSPGACLLLTVEGQSTWRRTSEVFKSAAEVAGWKEELETRGILFIKNDAWVGSTHPDFYHSTIHAPWYVLEHWAGFFDIEAYLLDGSWSQDLVVLKRRADGAPPTRPSFPCRQPPDPRADRRATAAGWARPWVKRAFAAAARGVAARCRSKAPRQDLDRGELLREIRMLRAGLYEQGRRISILGEELRRELRTSAGRDRDDKRS